MTDATASGPGAAEDHAETARRMRAIAAGLEAAGLTTRLHDTRAALDITATLHQPGCKETEVIVDQDGYVEIRYWNHAGATPARVTAVIVRALTAIIIIIIITTTQRT